MDRSVRTLPLEVFAEGDKEPTYEVPRDPCNQHGKLTKEDADNS